MHLKLVYAAYIHFVNLVVDVSNVLYGFLIPDVNLIIVLAEQIKQEDSVVVVTNISQNYYLALVLEKIEVT